MEDIKANYSPQTEDYSSGVEGNDCDSDQDLNHPLLNDPLFQKLVSRSRKDSQPLGENYIEYNFPYLDLTFEKMTFKIIETDCVEFYLKLGENDYQKIWRFRLLPQSNPYTGSRILFFFKDENLDPSTFFLSLSKNDKGEVLSRWLQEVSVHTTNHLKSPASISEFLSDLEHLNFDFNLEFDFDYFNFESGKYLKIANSGNPSFEEKLKILSTFSNPLRKKVEFQKKIAQQNPETSSILLNETPTNHIYKQDFVNEIEILYHLFTFDVSKQQQDYGMNSKSEFHHANENEYDFRVKFLSEDFIYYLEIVECYEFEILYFFIEQSILAYITNLIKKDEIYILILQNQIEKISKIKIENSWNPLKTIFESFLKSYQFKMDNQDLLPKYFENQYFSEMGKQYLFKVIFQSYQTFKNGVKREYPKTPKGDICFDFFSKHIEKLNHLTNLGLKLEESHRKSIILYGLQFQGYHEMIIDFADMKLLQFYQILSKSPFLAQYTSFNEALAMVDFPTDSKLRIHQVRKFPKF